MLRLGGEDHPEEDRFAVPFGLGVVSGQSARRLVLPAAAQLQRDGRPRPTHVTVRPHRHGGLVYVRFAHSVIVRRLLRGVESGEQPPGRGGHVRAHRFRDDGRIVRFEGGEDLAVFLQRGGGVAFVGERAVHPDAQQ